MSIANRKAATLYRLETCWERLESERGQAVEFRDLLVHLGRKAGRRDGGMPTERQLTKALLGALEPEYAGYGAGSNQHQER